MQSQVSYRLTTPFLTIKTIFHAFRKAPSSGEHFLASNTAPVGLTKYFIFFSGEFPWVGTCFVVILSLSYFGDSLFFKIDIKCTIESLQGDALKL